MPAGKLPLEDDLDGFTGLVDRIATVVGAVAGVHGLNGGAVPQVATLLPGRRVPGLRITDEHCEVHITADLTADLVDTARAVREAVRPLVGDLPLDVYIEDVTAPASASARRTVVPPPPSVQEQS